MEEKKMNVIGTAKLKIDAFRDFRKNEREKRKKKELCWPAALWKDYFYEHQDLNRYAEAGYYDCNCLRHTPMDSFDKKVEKTDSYLSEMGLEWDLLFTNDKITVIRYGRLEFGLPPELVDCHPYKDLDHYTVNELRTAAGTEHAGMNSLVPAGDVTRSGVKKKITAVEKEIRGKEEELQALQEKRRTEIEEMRRQIEQKYSEQAAVVEEKKREMEAMMQKLHAQLFILDTELYAIRCFMGETVNFVKLRSGNPVSEEVPVVLYQKLRFLDEEMGKYLAVYGFDGSDIHLFEDALKNRDDLADLFAPPEKSVSLIRISRNAVQYGENTAVANLLTEYETYHGTQIGILVRDGGNLWIAWTDEERINITEDAFLKPGEEVTTEEEAKPASSKEEIASRYFIFSILQGIISNEKMIRLPKEASVFRENPYVIYSLADGWLEDNRFGSFSDIVDRTDQPLKVGDMVLTTLHISRDDRYSGRYFGRSSYQDAWNNDRGRGAKNRTHDASIPDQTILPVNVIDNEVCYHLLYDEYRSNLKSVPTENEKLTTWKTERTGEKIGEGYESFLLWNGYFDGRKSAKYDLRGFSDEEIYKWYLEYDRANWSRYEDSDLIDPLNETACYRIPKGIKMEYQVKHYYLSAEKRYSYGTSGEKSRANMEIRKGEYLNLTYLNSVYVLYAIRNRNIGGWIVGEKSIDYAASISYLNIALEYLRKREVQEAEMLKKYIDLYPEWQVDLSEWRLTHGYHRLTDARAKRFASEKERSLQ